MRQLARGDDVQVAIAVQIADRDVFGRARFLTLGQRHQLPSIRIGAAEGDTDVAFGHAIVLIVRLVHGDDVQVAVPVEIGHDQPVAAAQLDSADSLVIDQVLAPGDVGAVRGPCLRRGEMPDPVPSLPPPVEGSPAGEQLMETMPMSNEMACRMASKWLLTWERVVRSVNVGCRGPPTEVS